MSLKNVFPVAFLLFANVIVGFKTINPLLNGCAQNPKENSIQPSVEIRKTADGHVLAVVKDHPSYPSTVFALQTTEQIALANPVILNDIEITYGGDYVLFRSKQTNQNVSFRLTNSNFVAPPNGNVGSFKGFGVIKSRSNANYATLVSYGGPTYPPIQEDVICDCNEANLSDSGCSSGGQGASSCSMNGEISVGASVSAGCSVTCGAGYYACCYAD